MYVDGPSEFYMDLVVFIISVSYQIINYSVED